MNFESLLSHLKLSPTPNQSTEALLQDLHIAHATRVPFENIDVFLNRGVSLDLPAIYEKLFNRNRGGYCFELNLSFASLLSNYKFSYKPVLGRVWMGKPSPGGRTHLAHLVSISGKPWLADVGFGGPGLLEPVPFVDGWTGTQSERKLRLRLDRPWGLVLEDEFEGSWRSIYSICDQERTQDIDIAQGNHYCATHPDSVFRKNLYIVKLDTQTRQSISGLNYQSGADKWKMEHIEFFGQKLTEMGIQLPDQDLNLLWKQLHLGEK